MKTYAHIYLGNVIEIIAPATYQSDSPEEIAPTYSAGDEIPIGQRFTPEFVAALVDITEASPVPAVGWAFDGTTFSAPAPIAIDYASVNAAERDALMTAADNATFGMADAFVAGLLDTADTATFKAWAAYKLSLSKVDLTAQTPAWPTTPASS